MDSIDVEPSEWRESTVILKGARKLSSDRVSPTSQRNPVCDNSGDIMIPEPPLQTTSKARKNCVNLGVNKTQSANQWKRVVTSANGHSQMDITRNQRRKKIETVKFERGKRDNVCMHAWKNLIDEYPP